MRRELDLPTAPEPVVGSRFFGRGGVVRQVKPFSWQMSPSGWFVVDFMAAYLAAWLAHWLIPQEALSVDPLRAGIISGAVVGVFGHVLGLHDTHHERREWKVLLKTGAAVSGGVAVLSLLSPGLILGEMGRAHLAVGAIAAGVVMTVSRSLVWQFVSVNRHRVCLIGEPDFCKRSRDFLCSQEGVRPLDVMSIQVSPDLSGNAERPGFLRLERNGSVTSFMLVPAENGADGAFDFEAWVELNEVDEVVVQGYSMPLLGDGFLQCLDAGIRVSGFNEFVESNYRCVPVAEIDHGWFLAGRSTGLGVYYQTFKRVLEVVVALLGMVLSLPLVLIAALAIRCSGPGPIFYSQMRVGRRNQPFRIFKLRTMRPDAEAEGAKWASKGDSRVTPTGRLLRKIRLDEVPQFWNIIRGDMAFTGPRPERPEFVGDLVEKVPFYNQRHLVKPGLTGWAQINCPYASSAEDSLIKLKYDLYYVKHATLKLDLHILFRTVGAIMKGAR